MLGKRSFDAVSSRNTGILFPSFHVLALTRFALLLDQIPEPGLGGLFKSTPHTHTHSCNISQMLNFGRGGKTKMAPIPEW